MRLRIQHAIIARVMGMQEREQLEEAIRLHCEAGRWAEAATTAIEGYGHEIFGYMSAAASSEADAEEAFSSFSEALWRGLPRFRFASSLRTWAYVLARHAIADIARSPDRRRKMVSPSEAPEVAQLAAAVRSSTMTFMRTETKSEVARLRESLDPDDRTLLILRVDRDMPWEDIARVLFDGDGEPGPDDIRRRSAALRKRFERVKAKLRKLAQPRND